MTPAGSGYTLTWRVSGNTTIMIAFIASATPTPAPQYPDVAESAWYATAVNYVSQQGLMKGYEDGTFRPDGEMTIAEYLTIMYRYAYDQVPSVISVKDSTGANWMEAANWVNTYLLGGSYTDLNAKMTRYNMADITYVVLRVIATYNGELNTRATHGFTDVPADSSYASVLEYLESVYAIDGNPVGNGTYTFLGDNNIKRSEVSQVLYNFMTKQ